MMWHSFRHPHARRARLGQKMKGMARVYDHVTPEMRRQIIQALEARWWSSVAALLPDERAQLGSGSRTCVARAGRCPVGLR